MLVGVRVSRKVLGQIEGLRAGDLVRVDWFDASVGRSSSGGPIDIPVKSWGIYLGVFGERSRQIVLAQNIFRCAQTLYDIDYTAIPITWTINISVISKSYVGESEVKNILNSFISGNCRAVRKREVNLKRRV